MNVWRDHRADGGIYRYLGPGEPGSGVDFRYEFIPDKPHGAPMNAILAGLLAYLEAHPELLITILQSLLDLLKANPQMAGELTKAITSAVKQP